MNCITDGPQATSVLGSIGARCRVNTVGAGGLRELAETLFFALASARHRGAFEQAYVAYERVLHRYLLHYYYALSVKTIR